MRKPLRGPAAGPARGFRRAAHQIAYLLEGQFLQFVQVENAPIRHWQVLYGVVPSITSFAFF
jgi:hypothetical protein